MSYLHVLKEPTAFEEIEREYYAIFPSVTLCKRTFEMDTMKTFADVSKAIEEFHERVWLLFSYDETKIRFEDLKNGYLLEKELDSTLKEVWEFSGIVQPEAVNAIIPCITINIPYVNPPKKGSFVVSCLI